MKRGREEENSHDISPSPTRLRHGGVINIPPDVTVEILKKLPVKSLMRFRCVSKLWSSIISSRRDLIDSIVTRSLNQPPRDIYIVSRVLNDTSNKSYIAVRGLICCWSKSDRPYAVTIFNPTTRQTFDLPELKSKHVGNFFLGYDPRKNQYKVMFLPNSDKADESCQVFTLGDPTAKQWRNIQRFIPQDMLLGASVCINGTIYYREATWKFDYPFPVDIKLLSFDVSSEELNHIKAPKHLMLLHRSSTLINYKEKLGLIGCQRGVEIWVMETQGWSKFFCCEMDQISWSVAGTTRGGEIVFVKSFYYSFDKLRVYYYDLKRNSMRYVDIENCYTEEGSRKRHQSKIWIDPGHVENIMGLH